MMRNLPPGPSVGDKVTAELVRELIRCIRSRQLLRGPGYALKTSPNGTTIQLLGQPRHRTAKQPRPWEVHYFPDAADGDGAWGVYLPAGSLNVAGEEIMPADSSGNALVALGAKWPGYYAVPTSASQPDAVWLHVFTLDDAEDSGTDAGDSSSSSGGSGGSGSSSVESSQGCVAVVGDEADIAAPEGYTLLTAIRICAIDTSGATTQLIVGAIALGGGGGGEGGTIDVGYPNDTVTSVAYTNEEDSYHPYAIKIGNGNLKKNTDGKLIIEENSESWDYDYIETVPISSVVSADCLITEGEQ